MLNYFKEKEGIRVASEQVHVVTDPEQARLLTDPRSVRYFKPFLGESKTQSQAAAELGAKLGTVHYRVGTFLQAGLLEAVRVQKRAGRAIKHYRSIRPEVFIPFALTPYATLEESLGEQLAPVWKSILRGLARSYHDQGLIGRKIARDDQGVVLTSPSTHPDRDLVQEALGSDALYTDVGLLLSDREAGELRQQITELYTDVYTRAAQSQFDDNVRRKVYLFQIAILPYEQP